MRLSKPGFRARWRNETGVFRMKNLADSVRRPGVIARSWARMLLGLVLLGGVRAADYFVSPAGSDAASGRSPGTAWRSVERVNRQFVDPGVEPGDRFLFHGGASFPGNLIVDRHAGGEADRPITFSSFGRGRAILLAGMGTGILVRDTPWISLSNLVLRAGRMNNGDGIRFDRARPATARIPGVRIQGCSLQGFAWHGIMVDAAQREHGFENVRIADCDASRNRHAGIMVYGGNPTGRSHHPHSDVEIRDCRAFGNPGDPAERGHHSGSGILMDGVDRGGIRGCVAWGNGEECRSERGGPVGIWAHASRRIVIEGCEAYDNRTAWRDGGGFDLDGGCEDAELRGNFAHDNAGPGFMVYTYAGAPYTDRNCRVTGNISWRDGRRGSGYAGLQVGAEEGCQIVGLEVTGNHVFAPEGALSAVRILGHRIQARIASNTVVASPHCVLISLGGFDHQLEFFENRYWRGDGRSVFLIDSQWPVASLDGWRPPSGDERRFRARDEAFGDPGFQPRLSRERFRDAARPRWPVLGR